MAKKAGLSFAELNELRVSDLLDFIDSYFGMDKDTPKEATQEDIDRFFG